MAPPLLQTTPPHRAASLGHSTPGSRWLPDCSNEGRMPQTAGSPSRALVHQGTLTARAWRWPLAPSEQLPEMSLNIPRYTHRTSPTTENRLLKTSLVPPTNVLGGTLFFLTSKNFDAKINQHALAQTGFPLACRGPAPTHASSVQPRLEQFTCRPAGMGGSAPEKDTWHKQALPSRLGAWRGVPVSPNGLV